ncbi:MAG: peptidylprolyl isomerase [Bacteroidetes bacterium]|nr:peptidylprolyl isomerase [Bacteroidota bacterium]
MSSLFLHTRKTTVLLFLLMIAYTLTAQQNIDKTIAVIGKYIVLRSEFERELKALKSEGIKINDSTKGVLLDELMYQKLLVSQAEKDSTIQVKDDQVETELNRRMNYYLAQFGSEDKFEAFYGKPVKQYKEEMRDDIRYILLSQQMQQKIVGDAKVSPSDVRSFFNAIPTDSLPLVSTEVEIGQLIKKPVVSVEAKQAARSKLEGLRQRVLNGESMSTIAALYTDDPGSARSGGEYDNIARGQFVPEFESVAFRLKPGEISEVFESPFGYHFIQLIARRGEIVDVRHILSAPKISNQDVLHAKTELDTIYKLIIEGKTTFCAACAKHSDDKDTKNNCGILQNANAGTTKFEIEQIGQMDQNLVFMLDKMVPGDISKPIMHSESDGKQSFKIIYLKSRSEPHKASLKEDYQRIQNMAQMTKQKKLVDIWVNKKLKGTYVHIDADYKNLPFKRNWKQEGLQ